MVIPYPRHAAEEENLKLILDAFRKFAAAEIDSRKIDEEAAHPPQVLAGPEASSASSASPSPRSTAASACRRPATRA